MCLQTSKALKLYLLKVLISLIVSSLLFAIAKMTRSSYSVKVA